jgi:phosphoribosylaminoimidazole carboxylase (NCAIR synthetase)
LDRHVVLVAPHFLSNTLRYVRAFTELSGVETSVVSEAPESALPSAIRERIAGHYRVPSCLDARQLAGALKVLSRAVGPIDRLAGVLEQLQLPLAAVRDALDIPGMRSDIARNFRDKDRMKEVLRVHDVPVARSVLAEDAAALRAAVDALGLPVIVKPQAGLGARATRRIESRADLDALIARGEGPRSGAPVQVEEFVRAREHTCETVAVLGRPVWRSGTRYFPSPLEVLENPWMQYCVLLPAEADDPTFTAFHPICDRALDVLGAGPSSAWSGITHMEWFAKDDGAMLVSEVGARPPGVQIMPLMSLAHDVDMIAAWAGLVALDTFDPPRRRRAAGAAFFRGQGSGSRIVRIHGEAKAREATGAALVEMVLPPVGTARADGYEGEGHAIVAHDTTDGAREALKALVSNVVLELG